MREELANLARAREQSPTKARSSRRRDFYRQLCVALGLSPKATAAAAFHAVTPKSSGGSACIRSSCSTILHEATRGQLRDIDRVATNAMRLAARRKQSLVDRNLLEHVLERDQQPGGPT